MNSFFSVFPNIYNFMLSKLYWIQWGCAFSNVISTQFSLYLLAHQSLCYICRLILFKPAVLFLIRLHLRLINLKKNSTEIYARSWLFSFTLCNLYFAWKSIMTLRSRDIQQRQQISPIFWQIANVSGKHVFNNNSL